MSEACLACGGDKSKVVRVIRRAGDARIVECGNCKLVQLAELPSREELDELYSDGYFEGVGKDAGYEIYANQEAEYLRTFSEDVRRIREFVQNGQVLDVGCGFGYFVRSALEGGLDAYGIDLSEEGIREAEKHAPGRVFRGTVGDTDEIAGRSFDVVFASHLIEHITEPVSFLASLMPRLAEDGIVMFVTPNVESWLSRISGSRWVSYKIPEHVAYYSPKTIERLLNEVGLEVIAIDSAYQYYRLPFLMGKIRDLIRPLGAIVPKFENWSAFSHRMIRVTSGSLRVIARRRSASATSDE